MKYFKFRDHQEILKIEDRLFPHVKRNEGDKIVETDEFGNEPEMVIETKPELEVKKEQDKSVITPEQITELTKPVELKEKKNAIKGAYKQRQTKKA